MKIKLLGLSVIVSMLVLLTGCFDDDDVNEKEYTREETPKNDLQPNSPTISEADARSIALAKVPGAQDENFIYMRRDSDDGKEVFEGKIIFNQMEYEFEILTSDGSIVSWETDSVDAY